MMMIVRVAVLLSLFCSIACGPATGQEGDAPYRGDLYEGRVQTQVLRPGEPGGVERDIGSGKARFVALGEGRSRLVVEASIQRAKDAGFTFAGRRDAQGWRGGAGGLTLAIDRNGRISGGGIEGPRRVTFGGHMDARKIDLRVETENLATGGSDARSAGVRVIFDYELVRDAPAGSRSETASRPATKEGGPSCKRIVWQVRNVASPGGGMTMIQVPHCVK